MFILLWHTFGSVEYFGLLVGVLYGSMLKFSGMNRDHKMLDIEAKNPRVVTRCLPNASASIHTHRARCLSGFLQASVPSQTSSLALLSVRERAALF